MIDASLRQNMAGTFSIFDLLAEDGEFSLNEKDSEDEEAVSPVTEKDMKALNEEYEDFMKAHPEIGKQESEFFGAINEDIQEEFAEAFADARKELEKEFDKIYNKYDVSDKDKEEIENMLNMLIRQLNGSFVDGMSKNTLGGPIDFGVKPEGEPSEDPSSGENKEKASSKETSSKKDASKEVSTKETSSGNKVYLAGPLFNQGEKEFNLQITELLEEHGYEVFLPQRDGYLAAELKGKTEEELAEMIFEKDYGEVMKADIIFMNLDGRVPDEGACVELGIGYAAGKRCYGFKTDTRSVELNMDLNPMIAGCFIKCFENFDGDALIREIDRYLENNTL